MASHYRYLLEDRAVEALMFVTEAEQDFLVAYFRPLASQPHTGGDAWCIDSAGRKNFAHTSGPFTVAHWTDHAAKEVRIVEFKRS